MPSSRVLGDTEAPEPSPTPGGIDRAHADVCAEIQRAIECIHRLLDGPMQASARSGAEVKGYAREHREKLGILRALVQLEDPVLEPDLNPAAPLGHAYTPVEGALGLEPGEGRRVLEELADRGILRRELYNTVHTCPRCRTWRINFRETCPFCGSLDLQIERLLHHFACAHVGLESEFARGVETICPKCSHTLEQLGQDFDRPSDTYVCRDSSDLFDAPLIEGQCLHCSHLCRADELVQVPIHGFRPTALAVRAVELNRLSGLDLTDVLCDPDAGLNTREFFEVEIERELVRMERHGGGFSVGILSFAGRGEDCPIFRDWPASALRELGRLLVNGLRALDVVARLDGTRIGFLLIEDSDGSAAGERVLQRLEAFSFRSMSGPRLVPTWTQRGFSDPATTMARVRAYLEGTSEVA